MDEAADAIERLRAHNTVLCDNQHDHVRYCTKIHDLEAEIERLRALILDGCAVFEHYDLPEHALHYRRALEPKP